jgi:hypothetical protein
MVATNTHYCLINSVFRSSMNDATSQPFPLGNDQDDDTTSPGGDEEVRWETVARTPGITPATILAGRLQAEGIPARAWQEGAGQALGLTVGLLGTGHVAVPTTYVEQAREILADVDEVEDWDVDADDSDDEEA